MAERVLELQKPDGLWGADMLNPDTVPGPESSGSGFFVYALAYGLNEGLIDRKHQPAVEKGWIALTKPVKPDGRLTYVQPTGESPCKVTPDSTLPYGVGALLPAGSEMGRLEK